MCAKELQTCDFEESDHKVKDEKEEERRKDDFTSFRVSDWVYYIGFFYCDNFECAKICFFRRCTGVSPSGVPGIIFSRF